MPLTPHQLKIPSGNTPLTDPAWAESLRAECSRVLEMPDHESRVEYPDVVLLARAKESGYGPTTPAQQVVWTVGAQVFRAFRSRPGSGFDPETIDEIPYPGEGGHPEQWDLVAVARQLGHEDRIAVALTKAEEAKAAHLAANPRKDGKGPTPKALVNAPAEAHKAMHSAIVGVREPQPVRPVGKPSRILGGTP
jgi:hypothetical protein